VLGFDNKNLANSIPTESNTCLFSRLEGRKGSLISGSLVVYSRSPPELECGITQKEEITKVRMLVVVGI
jgi:hypothetical protein